MLTHVNQRGARSVRQSEKIDAFVAEPASHLIEVIHRDRSRVLREISALLQRSPQVLHVIHWIHLGQVILGRFLFWLRRQRIRLSCSPLIDQHDVMLASVFPAFCGIEYCATGRSHARSTGEIKYRQFSAELFLIDSRQPARPQLGKALTVSATVQSKKAKQARKNDGTKIT